MMDSLSTPLYQTSVNEQLLPGVDQAFTYGRDANPTVAALEHALARLESAAFAYCFSSGMAAISTLMLSLLHTESHLICDTHVYPGTVRLLTLLARQYGITISFVDLTDMKAFESAICEQTDLVFFETPSTPALKLIDMHPIARIAKAHQLITIVDNTLLTPALQKPLDAGIDVSLYSTTKFIDGHNAAMGGAVVSNHRALMETLRSTRNTFGTIQSPWNAWLTLQGTKTLALRMRQQSEHALSIAQFLSSHPRVAHLVYPGLLGDIPRALGSVISFELMLDQQGIFNFLKALTCCKLAGSFGSTITFITHPATMFDPPHHDDIGPMPRFSDRLLRLSVGLEDVSSIIEDLTKALTSCYSPLD